MKKAIYIVISMAFGLVLCVALAQYLNFRAHDWIGLLQNLSFPWIIAVTALTYLLWWSGARKWALFSRVWHNNAGHEPYEGFFLRHYAWQNWIGQFVPPSLAIVLGRSWAARDMAGVSYRSGASNAIYDQALELGLLFGLLPAAYLVLQVHAGWMIWVPVSFMGVGLAGSLFWILHLWFRRDMRPFLMALLGWSALRVVLTILRLVVMASALGLALDPVSIAAASPVVALLALIPLTPGNLGLAEWGWTGVLVYAGNDPVAAGLLALGARMLLLVVQSILLAALNLRFIQSRFAVR